MARGTQYKPRQNWNRKLPQPIKVIDGTQLRTLADVRRFMVELPDGLALR
jgi:hypothetical protein